MTVRAKTMLKPMHVCVGRRVHVWQRVDNDSHRKRKRRHSPCEDGFRCCPDRAQVVGALLVVQAVARQVSLRTGRTTVAGDDKVNVRFMFTCSTLMSDCDKQEVCDLDRVDFNTIFLFFCNLSIILLDSIYRPMKKSMTTYNPQIHVTVHRNQPIVVHSQKHRSSKEKNPTRTSSLPFHHFHDFFPFLNV